jgi:hypothetical protein
LIVQFLLPGVHRFAEKFKRSSMDGRDVSEDETPRDNEETIHDAILGCGSAERRNSVSARE